MRENFQAKGHWWLPGEEANRISGTLNYDTQDGIRLDLIGNFICEAGIWKERREVVIGTTDYGQILLYESDEMKDTLGATYDMVVSSYLRPKYIVLDKYSNMILNDDFNIEINTMEYEPKFLVNWLRQQNFVTNSSNNGRSCNIEYNFPSEMSIYESDSFNMSIDFHTTASSFSINNQATVQAPPYIKFHKEERVSPVFFLGQIYKLHRLFNYIWRIKVPCLRLEILQNGRRYPILTNIYSLLQENTRNQQAVFPIFFNQLGIDTLRIVTNNWFEIFNSNEFTKILELYFYEEFVQDKKMFITQFTVHVKFLEFMARIWCNDVPANDIPDEITQFQEELRIFFENATAPATVLETFQQRFMDETVRATFRSFLRGIRVHLNGLLSLPSGVVNDIVVNRNFYTHYQVSSTQESLILEGEELYELAKISKIVCEILLLKRIGFSDEHLQIMLPSLHNPYTQRTVIRRP